MTRLLQLLPLFTLLVSTAWAFPSPAQSQPLPPSQDPFYKPPPFYESTAPGTVLRVRTATGNLASLLNASEVYNVLYRTTDSLYKPSWAMTTLIAPSNHKSSGKSVTPKRLLSYQVPYDSPDVDSSPSYTLATLFNDTFPDLELALNDGWFVNIPDYEGPHASFTAGVQSGHATLDSVRAILNSKILEADEEEVRTVLWGYSGGALATEWAAEMQVQYAPELSIRGAAAGGLPADILATMAAVNEQLYSGLIVLSVLGLASQYSNFSEYLQAHLNPSGPYNRTTFMETVNMNYLQGLTVFAFQNINNYFTNGEAFAESEEFRSVYYRDGLMGYHSVPQIPMFVYKAIHDEVTPVAPSDLLIERYCAVGGNILYQRNTIGGHNDENTNGRQRAWTWLTQAIDNASFQSGCVIQNVTVGTMSTGQ